jgi:hypothetical protein
MFVIGGRWRVNLLGTRSFAKKCDLEEEGVARREGGREGS